MNDKIIEKLFKNLEDETADPKVRLSLLCGAVCVVAKELNVKAGALATLIHDNYVHYSNEYDKITENSEREEIKHEQS
jgi:hypothetical protein